MDDGPGLVGPLPYSVRVPIRAATTSLKKAEINLLAYTPVYSYCSDYDSLRNRVSSLSTVEVVSSLITNREVHLVPRTSCRTTVVYVYLR